MSTGYEAQAMKYKSWDTTLFATDYSHCQLSVLTSLVSPAVLLHLTVPADLLLRYLSRTSANPL